MLQIPYPAVKYGFTMLWSNLTLICFFLNIHTMINIHFLFLLLWFLLTFICWALSPQPDTKYHKLLSHGSLFLHHHSQGPFSLNFISTKMTINIPQAGIWQNYRKRGEILHRCGSKKWALEGAVCKIQLQFKHELQNSSLPLTGHTMGWWDLCWLSFLEFSVSVVVLKDKSE